MAPTLLESGALQLARQTALRALEEAAGDVGGAATNEACANVRGVSLARNVLANAADDLAQQGWAVTLALHEAFERKVASAVDAMLGDAELLAHASDDEVRKLEEKRAHATALLERATDLVRALQLEEREKHAGLQAAETAANDAEAAHALLQERLQASDEIHALRLQMETLYCDNERLASEQARLKAQRDELVTAATAARQASKAGC
jgi:hypothetical protein